MNRINSYSISMFNFYVCIYLVGSQPTESSGDDKKRGGDSQDSPGTPKRSIGQAEIESSMCKFDGTFADHLEMLVQMGYVVLFSSAFPLAGLCALANNLMEIRSDAFKLAHVHQVATLKIYMI